MPVGARDSDESLFLALNRYYMESTKKVVRYLSLRGVTKIHYVRVSSKKIHYLFQRLTPVMDVVFLDGPWS